MKPAHSMVPGASCSGHQSSTPILPSGQHPQVSTMKVDAQAPGFFGHCPLCSRVDAGSHGSWHSGSPPLECCFGTSPIQAEKFRLGGSARYGIQPTVRLVGAVPGQDPAVKLQDLRLQRLAPPNRGSINSTHIHGTHVPVEEPSTASKADAASACGMPHFHADLSLARGGRSCNPTGASFPPRPSRAAIAFLSVSRIRSSAAASTALGSR